MRVRILVKIRVKGISARNIVTVKIGYGGAVVRASVFHTFIS